MKDPTFEFFRGRKLTTKNQRIHSRFVDDCHVRVARNTVANRDAIFVIVVNMFCKCIARICVTKSATQVDSDEPNFFAAFDVAKLPELLVLKELRHDFRQIFSFHCHIHTS